MIRRALVLSVALAVVYAFSVNGFQMLLASAGAGGFVGEAQDPGPTQTPGYELFQDLDWASYLYLGDDHEFVPAVIDVSHRIVNSDGWNIDTPEDPDAVLPFLTYLEWIGASPPNITNVDNVRITMRGDGLNLYGGYADFWIVTVGTRWHLIAPMQVTNSMTHFDLDLGGSWYRSWTVNNKTLAQTKASVTSYGISFLGWSQEPTGTLIVQDIRWFQD